MNTSGLCRGREGERERGREGERRDGEGERRDGDSCTASVGEPGMPPGSLFVQGTAMQSWSGQEEFDLLIKNKAQHCPHKVLAVILPSALTVNVMRLNQAREK